MQNFGQAGFDRGGFTVPTARLEAVAYCQSQADWANDVRAALRSSPDMDRALSRLALDRGGPRDLAAIRDGLAQARHITGLNAANFPDLVTENIGRMAGFAHILDALEETLVAEPPLLARDGGFIAEGVDEALDEARKLRDEGRGVIAGYQADYAAETGVRHEVAAEQQVGRGRAGLGVLHEQVRG